MSRHECHPGQGGKTDSGTLRFAVASVPYVMEHQNAVQSGPDAIVALLDGILVGLSCTEGCRSTGVRATSLCRTKIGGGGWWRRSGAGSDGEVWGEGGGNRRGSTPRELSGSWEMQVVVVKWLHGWGNGLSGVAESLLHKTLTLRTTPHRCPARWGPQ